MSEKISPRCFSTRDRAQPERRRATFWRSGAGALSAIVLVSSFGCASAGSSYGTGGTTGAGTGGTIGSSGGSGAGMGAVTGSGGSDTFGSGGTSSGTGGETTGSGGNNGQGTGGANTTGTGGRSSSGGSAPGTGGATGTGGTAPGTGGASATGGRGGTTAGSGGAAGRAATGGTTGSGGAAVSACPKVAPEICHEFYANDNSANRIIYVNEFDPSKNWVVGVGDSKENSPRTIEIVDNDKAVGGKAILVSVDKGYAEFDIGNKGALLTRVSNKSGVSGACRMLDGTGNTALGIDSVNAIVIVNPTGSEVRRIAIPAGDNLRAINYKSDTKTFWFSETNLVYEINESGTVKWMGNMGANTKGYAVWWNTATGGAWATTGEPSTVIELNSAGVEIVAKRIGGKTNFPGLLDFFSGFVRLPNGNFVVANWLGHMTADSIRATAPHLVEFSPDNKLVWRWGKQSDAKQITNVYVVR